MVVAALPRPVLLAAGPIPPPTLLQGPAAGLDGGNAAGPNYSLIQGSRDSSTRQGGGSESQDDLTEHPEERWDECVLVAKADGYDMA
jgi:hypothetical protein